MASILRSGKFARYFVGFARSIVFNAPRETEGNLLHHSKNLFGSISHFATAIPKTDQSLDRSLKKIDQDVRRSGRISRRDIEEVLEEIRQQRSATSSQSLLVIRCCGNLVPEELPEVRTTLVQEIWRTLNNLNVPMDISHYNALLRVYLENEHQFSPTEFLSELEAKGVEPNRVTYQRLVTRFCQMGDIQGATKILEFMREKQLPINEHVFNALIMGHSQAEDMESALAILSVMKQAGLEPSADTYTILLCSYAKIGDLESIEKTLKTCDENDVVILDKDILDVVYELTTNGHAEKIDPLLDRLRKMTGYNQDAINLILRLTNKHQVQAALKILKTMSRNTRPDGELNETGSFFIRQMVKAKVPTDDILKICKELESENMNSRAYLLAVEAGISSGHMEVSIPLLKEIKRMGQQIRQHYFWPLLCTESKHGTDAVLNVIRLMISDFNVNPNNETVRDYVIPNLKENNPDKVITLLRSVGISTATATTSMVFHILSEDRLKEAAELVQAYNLYYQPGIFRKPLVNALVKTNDFDSYILFVRKLYDCIPRLGQLQGRRQEEEDINEDGNEMNSQNQAEVLGQLVFDALVHYRNDRAVAVANILDGLVEQGLTISSRQAERIQDRLGSELTDEISSLLGKLAGGELEPIPLEKTENRASGFAQMSPEQLERMIEMNEAKGENTKGLKRFLLTACFKLKDLKKTEEVIARLESENYVLTSGVYAQLVDLYCHHEEIDKALGTYEKIKSKEPDFLLDDFKTIKVAVLLTNKNRIDEALAFLEKNKKTETDDEERNFVYTNTCWRLFNSLADAGRADDLNKIFDGFVAGHYIEPTNVLLGPLVKVHIVNNNLEKAVETFESICNKHSCTPWKNDLACKLIQAEDAVNLQRLTDLSTNIHGEVNSLYDLVFSFVECGRIRQARKILETPGLRSRSQRINFACERYLQEGMVQSLEGLIEATKDLNHIDRSDIFYNLLLSYKKDNQPEKALGLWTKMQEEDIPPSDQFLYTLGQFLKSQNLEVPFIVPEMVKEKKVQQVTASATVDTATPKPRIKSLEIETLVKEGRINEATKKVFAMLRDQAYPIARVFRFYLNKIANSGDIQTLSQIGEKLSPETKKLLSFDNRFCQSYIAAGKSNEYLSILEADLENAKTETELNAVSEKFPRGGIIGILDSNPQLIEKYEKLAIKYAERDILAPINILWINHFLNGKDAEANEIWTKYLSNTPRIMFQKILAAARDKNNDKLILKLIDVLQNAKVSEIALGVAYSCLIDIYAAKGQYDHGLKALDTAVKNVCLENFNRTALIRIKNGLEKAGQTFPYKIPERNARNSKDDTSSSSSSSSDDEEVKK